MCYYIYMIGGRMKGKFDQSKYKQQYGREHYKVFKVDLKKEEFEGLEKMLNEDKKTKADFLRESIKIYKEKRNK